MSAAIRMETTATARLAQVQEWFSAHRGETIGLARERRIELGAPISGARAVLVAVTLRSADGRAPDLGGVVRALASRRGDEPALLVFEGRSPAHLPDDDAGSLAAELLEAISGMAAGHELIAEVA